ncbi:MAG: hypothetical protein N2053_00055 [Chitinispirillaceae bacterium]|nr:hypothetical protein [Chitinispirillaceae bacterium]
MRIKMSFLKLTLITLIVVNTWAESKVTFNVEEAKTIIPKELFGVLMERLGKQWVGGVFVGTNSSIPNINGMRKDVIDAFKECGVGAIEWPGGCAANSYNWSANKNPSNDVGTDRFMEFCSLVGAEPIICGRPTANDATSNRAWVEYINNNPAHPEWQLKYFKVGNEVWGCGGNQTVDTYIPNYTANYEKLKEPINGKKLFIIAANDIEGKWEWLPTMLSKIGNTIDGVEYHDYLYFPDSYSSTNPTITQYWDIVNRANNGEIVPHLDRNIFPHLDKYDPQKRIKLVIDEWGDWLMDIGDGWMQQNTLMDALSAGEQLNVFIQRADRIGIACLAQGVNVIHSLLNINSNGVMVKTPTFYVFKLYKPHHLNNAKVVPIVTSSIESVNGNGTSIPVLTATASVDTTGMINISLTNIDISSSRTVVISLINSKVSSYSVASAEIITGDAINSCNDFGKEEQVNIKTLDSKLYSVNGKTLNLSLPPKSIVMVRLTPSFVSEVNNIRKDKNISYVNEKDSKIFVTSYMVEGGLSLKIYSIDGRIVMKKEKDDREKIFRRKIEMRGVYFVVGENNKNRSIKRIFVTTK